MSLRGSPSYLWDITKPLGQGATSMVYKGRNKSTGEEVAVKVFSQAGQMRPHDVQMREFEVMRKLQHKNIVPMLAIEDEQSTRNKVIVMQLTEHGSLFNMLEDPKNAYGLPEEEFLIVFEHVTAGMKYMRDSGVVHRDIKPGNILRYIGEDGRSVYKLTDFGAAKQLDHDEEQFMSLYGTEEYLHPEMYARAVLRAPERKQFSSKVDLWSLGVTFFHVATGQLPFKPFGGRKNRQKMFEITRHKESGVIMGVQHSEGGAIEWSKELPQTCRLSDGLKYLITPIFARLLESDPVKVWTFEAFFNEVDVIIKKKVIHVFCPHTWNILKVYINSEHNLTILQELIAEQTEIMSPMQLLIFDGQQLKDHVQPMLPISSYPKGITETNPIFVYNKNREDFSRFPAPVIKEFPHFSSNLTIEDYAIAKLCSAISCYILREVQVYCTKQELMRRAVHMYIHEVYHELGHLLDYHTFLERNCDSTMKWKDNFLRTFTRELMMMKLLVEKLESQPTRAEVHLKQTISELDNFHKSAISVVDELSKQVIELNVSLMAHLMDLKNEQLQKKLLKKLWNDSKGCIADDRCVAKVEVVLEIILKIKAQFSEDRRKPSMTFNEEQIHKYEKNRLSEHCTRIKSLFYDHCMSGAKDQFAHFQSWFKMAWEIRHRCEILEKELLNLAERLEGFVDKLNTMCLQYNGEIERYLQRIRDAVKEREFISVTPSLARQASSLTESMATGTSAVHKKTNRQELLNKFIENLESYKASVQDMKRDLDVNNHLLKNFNEELSTVERDLKSHPLNSMGPVQNQCS